MGKGGGVEMKGFTFTHSLPLFLISSHSLAVSFPSLDFELKMKACHAGYPIRDYSVIGM